MTAKEKSIQLVWKFYSISDIEITYSQAKECALIAVDQMMLVLPFTDIRTSLGKYCEKERAWLEEVRHEIKKL